MYLLQAWSRSTQECTGQDRHILIFRRKPKLCQHRKRFLRHRGHLSQQQACYRKLETAYTIMTLKCGNDVIFIVRRKSLATVVRIVDVVNDDRKGRPATQILPDGCSTCAEKVEIEATRR